MNFDGVKIDPAAGEGLRPRRYTVSYVFAYQGGSAADIQALALREGISITPVQAGALSLGIDLNQDGLTNQWNEFGQLVAYIGPEGHVTKYYYDGDRVVEERNQFDVPLRQYVWGGGLVQMRTAAGTFNAHPNAIGSILATTDLEGEMVWDQFDYDAFGGVEQNGIETGLPFAFRGWFDQIQEHAAENAELRQAAMANTIDAFKYVFDKTLEGLFIDRLEQNDDITTRFLNDGHFQQAVTSHLREKVYEQIRSGAGEIEPCKSGRLFYG